jgi:hypothetical protein
MADLKISALTSAGALAGTEPLPIVQGGSTKKTTAQDIANLKATPDLQQVTDAGSTTTNDIIVDDGTNSVQIQPNQLKITNTIGYGTIGAANLTDTPNFELPNKAAGTFTFAMTSDITSGVASVSSGTNISVDNTDPANPIINSLADRYKTSSVTSNTIGNGSKTFTVDADLAYIPLQEVLIVNSPSNHMHGEVTSYSGTTLVVDVNHHTGSGTFASWVINLDGIPIDAITGVGTANEISYFTSGQVIASLPVATYPSLTELSYVKGVTSAIQTQLNALAQTVPISSCSNGTAITGTLLNTFTKALPIPAGSRTANQAPQVDVNVEKTGTAGNINVRLYWNTTPDIAGTPIFLGIMTSGATTRTQPMSRILAIEVANGTGNGTKVVFTGTASLTQWASFTSAMSIAAIDWTAAGNIVVAASNGSILDSTVCSMIKLH